VASTQDTAVCPELGPVGQSPGVVPPVGSLAERLGQAVDNYYRGAAQVLGFAFQDAEQPVVTSIGAADPDLVEAGHFVMHRLPFASTREGRRWCCGYGIEDGMDLGSHLDRQAVEKLNSGDGPGRIVRSGALEEMNEPWDRVGHARPTLDSPNRRGL